MNDSNDKPTFVLVHGGRHGGWAWRDIASRLRDRGHLAITPTLTGLGERSHLLSRNIGLQTHVEDLVRVFEYGDLSDVVLVAHSYGGMPVAGALERVADRVRSVVWLDSHLPREHESIFELIGEERAAQMKQMVEENGEGWFVPTSDASFWGLSDPAHIAWVNSKTTPQPVKTYQDPSGPTDRAWAHPGTAIECSPSKLPVIELERQRARAESDPHFHLRMIDACHEPMVTHPDELTELLIEAIDNL
jgi:pimeloyl-ACP methyl ester carboxylesterase